MKRQIKFIFMKGDKYYKHICADHFYLPQQTQLFSLHELQEYCLICKKYSVLSEKPKATDMLSIQKGALYITFF